jgi:hypothetical protein
MAQLRIYQVATIGFSPEDELALQTLLTQTDADGEIIEEPPEFPLTTGQLVFNGSAATISVMNGRKNRRVCRLTDAKLTEPKRDGDPVVVTGTVTGLESLGFRDEASVITATITKYHSCANC